MNRLSRLGSGTMVVGALISFGILATSIIEKTGLDLTCSRYFYYLGQRDTVSPGWVTGTLQPWSSLYNYGELPGLLLCGAALVAFIASWLGAAPKRWRKPCLVIILSVVIGPGLLVNGILKPYWGRSRPVDLVEFGGNKPYQDVWTKSCCGGRSFPCGHCAIGFSLSSIVALTPYHPVVGSLGLVFGLVYGSILSVARLAQGGHFLSDVLWSFVVVYAVIAILYYWFFPPYEDGR